MTQDVVSLAVSGEFEKVCVCVKHSFISFQCVTTPQVCGVTSLLLSTKRTRAKVLLVLVLLRLQRVPELVFVLELRKEWKPSVFPSGGLRGVVVLFFYLWIRKRGLSALVGISVVASCETIDTHKVVAPWVRHTGFKLPAHGTLEKRVAELEHSFSILPVSERRTGIAPLSVVYVTIRTRPRVSKVK